MRATTSVAPTLATRFNGSRICSIPGTGTRTCREQRIVGDGLVPSRCRRNRMPLMRATTSVAPTLATRFNGSRVCSIPGTGTRTCREQRIVGDGLVPSRCRRNRMPLMRATTSVAPTLATRFNGSRICSIPGTGTRTCREQRIVGDGLVPSRCRRNRMPLMRATTSVAPTLATRFNGSRICSMVTPGTGRRHARHNGIVGYGSRHVPGFASNAKRSRLASPGWRAFLPD